MYKISLLLLSISSPIYSMLSPVMQLAKRLPSAAHAGMQQPSILVQQRRATSESSALSEYIELVKNESKKMSPSFLAQLKYREADLCEYSSRKESEAAFSSKLHYIAAKAVLFGPSDDDMITGVCSGDPELVKHLLAHGANPGACEKWAGMSYSALDKAIMFKDRTVMRLLLQAGAISYKTDAIIRFDSAEIKSIFTFPGQAGVFSGDRDAIRKIIEDDAGYSFNYSYCSQQLTQNKQAEVLKKLMLVVHAGAQLDFYFRTGGFDNGAVYCDSSNDGSREMRFSELKGDWTKGKFTELANYFASVRILKDDRSSAQQKEAALGAIEGIMKKYDINEEDVTFLEEVSASRVQEAD